MKKLFGIFIFALLFVACKKSNNASCPDTDEDCSGVACLIHNYYFYFRLIDKTSGEDLVFGSHPRYTAADVSLFSDADRNFPIPIIEDAGHQYFKVSVAQPEMYLVIAGSGVYKLNVDFKLVDCCTSRVKNLSIDGRTICTCCSNAIELPVD